MHEKSLGPLEGGLDLDNRLGFVKTPVILRVATESVSQQWLQGLCRAVGPSTHCTGDDSTYHSYHEHCCYNADGDDFGEGISTNCTRTDKS